MDHEENIYQKQNIYTDLALEAHQAVLEDRQEESLEGVSMTIDENLEHDIKVTWVRIEDEKGAAALGKPPGNYVTIESPKLRENDVDAHEEVIRILSDHLGKLHNLGKEDSILIIGLGNWNVTPDALGPKVVSKALVTRHIKETLPDAIADTVRAVSALAPGVMGITGIETRETVKGLVDRISPDLVIAIDALASRSVERINAAIQLSDTGIAPGAGMGNMRKTLNEETLGVPVIAIGVPTVVDAATLINDTMDKMLEAMMEACEEKNEFYAMLQDMEAEEKYHVIRETLDPWAGNMFVTPKEVDTVVEWLSNIIANGLNIVLHPGITREDINRYLY